MRRTGATCRARSRGGAVLIIEYRPTAALYEIPRAHQRPRHRAGSALRNVACFCIDEPGDVAAAAQRDVTIERYETGQAAWAGNITASRIRPSDRVSLAGVAVPGDEMITPAAPLTDVPPKRRSRSVVWVTSPGSNEPSSLRSQKIVTDVVTIYYISITILSKLSIIYTCSQRT